MEITQLRDIYVGLVCMKAESVKLVLSTHREISVQVNYCTSRCEDLLNQAQLTLQKICAHGHPVRRDLRGDQS